MDHQEKSPLKIAIVGPESTGKSTLSEQLARHYGTVFVKEYAREYLENLNRPYEQTDLLKIAEGQIRLEHLATQTANKILFCDTNLMVIEIWSQYKYGNVDDAIIRLHGQEQYDLYLITNNDTDWEYDPLREAPTLEERNKIFDIYVKKCQSSGVPFEIITGKGEQRFQCAVAAIQKHFEI